jgi:2-polyprenyl-6-methoxyphenol hydroxylase-like FAD-dependent oxidoreductase
VRSLDVGVIGCGTAGSAAAVFLARAGHEVTLYERVPDPKPVGAGVTIQPTGLHVLCKLGLYAYVVSRGSRIDRLLCETRERRPIVDLVYTTAGEGLFGLGLHRGVLFEALTSLVRRLPIRLVTGVEITGLARAADGKRTWLVDTHDARHGPHELVVVADGARSQLRDDTSTTKSAERYPWGALWFVARDVRGGDDPRTRLLHQVCDGNQRFLGILPTGIGPLEGSGDPLVSLFWSIRADRVDAWRARGLDAWKAEIRELDDVETGPILDQITHVDEVLFAAYHDVVMHRWSTRNVVYLGDAAHATSPQLGQGCNLALWDAMTLAEKLEEEEHDLARALDRYTRARKDHLTFYQFATRWLTPLLQGDEGWLGSLRDAGMPLLGKVGLTNRLMTLSMLGVMEGFWGDTLTLRLPRE